MGLEWICEKRRGDVSFRLPSRRDQAFVMKFFRYRKPSLKTLLGITAAKKRIKKDLGITAILRPFRWWGNKKRKLKRAIGYESEAGRMIRNGLPKPGGCLVVAVGIVLGLAWLIA